jgi:hypothetical protein
MQSPMRRFLLPFLAATVLSSSLAAGSAPVITVLTVNGVSCGQVFNLQGGEVFYDGHASAPYYAPVSFAVPFPPSGALLDQFNGIAMGKVSTLVLAEVPVGSAQAIHAFEVKVAALCEVHFHAVTASARGWKEVTFVYQGQSAGAVEYPPVGTAALAKEGTTNLGYRLEVQGMDPCEVTAIDAFMIEQPGLQQSIQRGTALPSGAGGATAISPHLVLTVPRGNTDGFANWMQSQHHQEKKNATLTVTRGGQTIAVLQLKNLCLFGLSAVPNAGLAPVQMKAEFLCEGIQLGASGVASTGAGAPAVKGVQPPAGQGEFGKTYSMRRGEPLYFTLRSAAYAVAPVSIGENWFATAAAEKLLVLHFDIENPGPADRLVRFDSLRISAIDTAQVEHPQKGLWGLEGRNEPAAFPLASGKKVSLFAVVTVPAKGEPPTILVRSNRDNDGPDLPYEVHGHVPALPAPYADPTDPTGATALPEVPAAQGVAYPCDNFAVTVEKSAFTTAAIGEAKPNEGDRFLVFTLLVKNQTPVEHLLRFDMLQPVLTSKAGERLPYKGMVLENADRPVAQLVGPGAQMPVRIFFAVPKDATLQQLLLQEQKSRRYLYPVTG